mgnify:FL=1
MTSKTLYSGFALVSAVFIALCGVWIEPLGIVDTSLLYVVAQLLIYSASLLGISSAVGHIAKHLQTLNKQNNDTSKTDK